MLKGDVGNSQRVICIEKKNVGTNPAYQKFTK